MGFSTPTIVQLSGYQQFGCDTHLPVVSADPTDYALSLVRLSPISDTKLVRLSLLKSDLPSTTTSCVAVTAHKTQ